MILMCLLQYRYGLRKNRRKETFLSDVAACESKSRRRWKVMAGLTGRALIASRCARFLKTEILLI